MLRKKRVWLVAFISAVCACLVLLLVYARDRITPRACNLIQSGMTQSEVEHILGRSADRAYRPWDVATFVEPPPGIDPEWEKIWFGEKWMIVVQFDVQGEVCGKGCMENDFDNSPQGFFTSWRRIFRW